VLPVLESEIGPGIAAALARTARLLRADADTLDDLAGSAYGEVVAQGDRRGGEPGEVACDIAGLADLPASIRWRVLRSAAIDAGSPATALTAAHVEAVDRLVTAWHGQRGIDLPGGVTAGRCLGLLSFGRTAPGS
jgi:tRNA(Ile)-lysidine synthase